MNVTLVQSSSDPRKEVFVYMDEENKIGLEVFIRKSVPFTKEKIVLIDLSIETFFESCFDPSDAETVEKIKKFIRDFVNQYKKRKEIRLLFVTGSIRLEYTPELKNILEGSEEKYTEMSVRRIINQKRPAFPMQDV